MTLSLSVSVSISLSPYCVCVLCIVYMWYLCERVDVHLTGHTHTESIAGCQVSSFIVFYLTALRQSPTEQEAQSS